MGSFYSNLLTRSNFGLKKRSKIPDTLRKDVMLFCTHLEHKLLNIYCCQKCLGQKQYRKKDTFYVQFAFTCKTKGLRAVSYNSMLQCANVIELQHALTLIKSQGGMWRTRVQVRTQNFSMGRRGD